jgi:lysyl-tRNA synthetase class 1
MSSVPTRLLAFSDDMDALRKVPDNVPNREMLAKHLGKPLTSVPDPYEKYESFGHHNNAMLRRFLDSFGFEYDFQSSTEAYRAGKLDDVLLNVLHHYEEIMEVMLPSLREERSATYSPFLPVCQKTGLVLQVPMLEICKDRGTIVYADPITGQSVETPVTGGLCKLQWKVDWGGRWCAFDVDYEMSGKDLIDSVKLSSQICKILGGAPPETLSYELFLDQEGRKISKSKGNGLTIDEWLTYAPQESLAYYMFQTPRRAKRLSFDVIPRAVEDYMNALSSFAEQTPEQQIDNPVFHIHKGCVPEHACVSMGFNSLINLASVCGAETDDVLWGFVRKYLEKTEEDVGEKVADVGEKVTDVGEKVTDVDGRAGKFSFINQLIHHAMAYYHDFVKPYLQYRAPSAMERVAMMELCETLKTASESSQTLTADKLQEIVFYIGNKHAFSPLRAWFQALYEVLFGRSDGPRMGSFIALYGVENMCKLIENKLQNNGPLPEL